MLSQEIKNKIRIFAEEKVKKNDPTHQMPHKDKTVKWALQFAEQEKADKEVCWASAMLHDICKWEEANGVNHGTKGAEEAKECLLKLGIDETFVEQVRDAIYYHNKAFSGGSTERKILWDADKIQNMHPEGFQRMITFFEQTMKRKDAVKMAIGEYHFFCPLFRTESGKREAAKYREEMEECFRQLLAE